MENKVETYGKDLCEQIAKISGVSQGDVMKVLSTLGLERRLREASSHLSRSPALQDVFLGFRISGSTVSV